MTELRITVPDIRCVSCGKMAAGLLSHIIGDNLEAQLRVPSGWIRLQSDAYDTGRVDERNRPKVFGMCGSCYQAHPDLYGVKCTAVVERSKPQEE